MATVTKQAKYIKSDVGNNNNKIAACFYFLLRLIPTALAVVLWGLVFVYLPITKHPELFANNKPLAEILGQYAAWAVASTACAGFLWRWSKDEQKNLTSKKISLRIIPSSGGNSRMGDPIIALANDNHAHPVRIEVIVITNQYTSNGTNIVFWPLSDDHKIEPRDYALFSILGRQLQNKLLINFSEDLLERYLEPCQNSTKELTKIWLDNLREAKDELRRISKKDRSEELKIAAISPGDIGYYLLAEGQEAYDCVARLVSAFEQKMETPLIKMN